MINNYRHPSSEAQPIQRLASVPGSINLNRKDFFVHHAKKTGAVISAQQGVLYITQENDPVDHLLLAGDSVVIEKPGKILVEALFDSQFCIEAGSH